MSVLDKIIALFAPYDCLNCGREGRLVCRECLPLLPNCSEACYRCHCPSAGSLTCQDCRSSQLERVQVVTPYRGMARQLLWRLKSDGTQAAADIMAEAMSARSTIRSPPLIVPVPTASRRVRQRGYDQAYLIGRQLAKRTGLPLAVCLVRQGQTHQVGANRTQRMQQLAHALRVNKGALVRGADILLVDDVATTGATLEAAASALKLAGARHVEAIVFARPTVELLHNTK